VKKKKGIPQKRGKKRRGEGLKKNKAFEGVSRVGGGKAM